MQSHMAEETISKIHSIFSKFGIPKELHCDWDSNYTAEMFVNCMKNLDVTLTFISSYHHSSNPVELTIQTAKNIMKKCAETNGNWQLGLLEYLCTPISESLRLPAELLKSCMYKDILPYAFPRCNQNDTVQDQLCNHAEHRKVDHDKQAKSTDYEVLVSGTSVMIWQENTKSSVNGHILECEGKSYKILLWSGHSIWRNHIHVCHSCIPFSLNTLREVPLWQHSSVKQAVAKPDGVVSETPVSKPAQKLVVNKSAQSVPKSLRMTVTHSSCISVWAKRLGV